MELNIVFQNVYHGMHFVQELNGKDVFYKYWPSAYIDYYKAKAPNIVCLAEVPFDSQTGQSGFVDKFSLELNLPYVKTYTNEKSWLVEDKWYGMAILSKFPISTYESFNLPNPKLEIDHKDGSHWIMHDKGAQKAVVDVNGKQLIIFNLHYFPFHHFNRLIQEDAFHEIRLALSSILVPSDTAVSIICGDFNNKGIEIEQAFPELFADSKLSRAVTFNRSDYEKNLEGDITQIDHILYTSDNLKLLNSSVESNFSDHCGLFAQFNFS